MKPRHPAWLFIVNQNGGRLLEARLVPEERHQLTVQACLENEWESHEHGRPSPRTGKSGHSYSSIGHEEETMRRRFAQDAATWLGENVRKHDIERVAVLAPSRFLSDLRECWPPRLHERIDEYECGLGYMEQGRLVHHPLISKILGNGKRIY